ncbi:MAG: TetR/AcrR family transcriptional regulator [Oscillospiraceae bacterium]
MNIVHVEEVTVINPEITSKEEIMRVCRKIASEKGLKALNMRTVAGECGIALGTLYNYYADKETLVIAAVGSVWQDIFHLPTDNSEPLPFPEYVGRLFRQVQERSREYPGFFAAHSAAIAGSGKSRARDAMEQCFGHIRGALLKALRQDNSVSAGAFGVEITEDGFVEFVLQNIILLLSQDKSCQPLTEIIRRTIYQEGHHAGNI